MSLHGVAARSVIRIHSRSYDSVELPETLANALFLEIDLTRELPSALGRRRLRGARRVPFRLADLECSRFSDSLTTEITMSLYWYRYGASTSRYCSSLPSIKFLSSIFPCTQGTRSLARIRHVLKSPAFSVNRDSDVARILSAVGGPRGYGDEQNSTSRNTAACTYTDDLRGFYGACFTSEIRINPLGASAPPRSAATKYGTSPGCRRQNLDIRCKIVHTKSGTPVA